MPLLEAATTLPPRPPRSGRIFAAHTPDVCANAGGASDDVAPLLSRICSVPPSAATEASAATPMSATGRRAVTTGTPPKLVPCRRHPRLQVLTGRRVAHPL